jgi:hypothetical protein
MADTQYWPVAVVAILALVICTGVILWQMPEVPSEITAKVDNSQIVAGLNDLNTKIETINAKVDVIQSQPVVNPETPVTPEAVPAVSNEKVDKIYNKVLEEEIKSDKAEELINEEITTKDFKRAVKNAIVDYCNDNECDRELEDYKDITEIVQVEIDTEVDSEDASSEAIYKVYYFIDGDEDEQQKARISVEFTVTGLDTEDSFEDAEVDDYEVEVLKVYEN